MKKSITFLSLLIGLMTVTGCAAANGRPDGGYHGGPYPNGYMGGDGYLGDITEFGEVYTDLVENPFMMAETNQDSYFTMDSSTASYSNLRRFIKNKSLINADAIKTDELINYFEYDYAYPTNGDDFAAKAEIAEAPWSNNQLLTIGITSKKTDYEFNGNNYVFLIDVSGSMSSDSKLPLLKKSLIMLTENLEDEDRISIVTYASGINVVLDGGSGADKQNIINKIDSLRATGATNGAGGLEKAYEEIEKYYIENGNNRIIIASDGDFNIGYTTTEQIEELIKSKLENNIYVTCLGYGIGNYHDNIMETIARNGNGGYYYIDSEFEAKKVFLHDLEKTMFAVSKDTKTKVSFNPDIVDSYRLIGYENKSLTAEEFVDESVDAGEIGSGHTSVVCYEVVLKENASMTDNAFTLDINYKEPVANTSKSFNRVFQIENIKGGDSEAFKMVSSIIEFSLVIRNSQYGGTSNLPHVLEVLDGMPSVRADEYRFDFMCLVQEAYFNNLVASEIFDEVNIIKIYFSGSYTYFRHRPNTVLTVENMIKKIGFTNRFLAKHDVTFYYDAAFTNQFTDSNVSSSLSLFVKITNSDGPIGYDD